MTQWLKITAGVAACLFCSSASNATGPVTQSEFERLIRSAKPNSVIDLADRRVEASLNNIRPLVHLKIRGGLFGPVTLNEWRNVTFERSVFVGPPGTGEYPSLVVAYDGENLSFINCRFSGYRDAEGRLNVRGLSVRGGKNILIQGSLFSKMAGFTQFFRTHGVQFTGNKIDEVREGVNIIGAHDVLIEGNEFSNIEAFDGDHPDAIQIFTTNLTRPDDTGARNVTIRRNLISGNGIAQGIFIHDEIGLYKSGRGYQKYLIEDNMIINARWHGITLDHVQQAIVRNNRLIRAGNIEFQNRVTVDGGDAAIENNVASEYILNGDVKAHANRTVASFKPAHIPTEVASWRASEISR